MATLGQQLKAAREAKNLTLRSVAETTRIKSQQIEGLENDDYSSIPAPMYAKGFIKLYAQAVDLDPGPLLELYEESLNPTPPKRSAPPPAEKKTPRPPSPNKPKPHKPARIPDFRRQLDAARDALRSRLQGLDLNRLRAVGVPVAGGVVLVLVLVFSVRACVRAGSGDDPFLQSPRLLEPTPFRIPLPEAPE